MVTLQQSALLQNSRWWYLDVNMLSAHLMVSPEKSLLAWLFPSLVCLSDSAGNEASTASWVTSPLNWEGISQQGRFACTSSCSWTSFLLFGNDIYDLHFLNCCLAGAFLSWMLKHAVVKSAIWINFFFMQFNEHWQQTIMK